MVAYSLSGDLGGASGRFLKLMIYPHCRAWAAGHCPGATSGAGLVDTGRCALMSEHDHGARCEWWCSTADQQLGQQQAPRLKLGYSRFRPAAGSLMLRHRRLPMQTQDRNRARLLCCPSWPGGSRGRSLSLMLLMLRGLKRQQQMVAVT
jgi:hypothetical protein